MPRTPCLTRTVRSPDPVDLGLTLGPLQRGPYDLSLRFDGAPLRSRSAWRATRTPEGPATTRLVADPAGAAVEVTAWGPGAEWALDAAPSLLGVAAPVEPMRAAHPVIAGLQRRLVGLRIPRSQAVVEATVPLILEQKVIGLDAHRSYRALVRAKGERAPGPAPGLLVPPAPPVLAATPSWVMHRWNLERGRAETVRRACGAARRLEEARDMAPDAAQRRLMAVPGIGPWTAAKVALVALGDADAVPVGDYHLPHAVCWALAGKARGDDATMLELLEPYRGRRGFVIRLLTAGGVQAPRYGPRLPLHAIHDL